MFSNYSYKVIEHFMSPRNVGSLKNPDAKGSYGDFKCGDSLTIYIAVNDDIIEEIGYLVFGCTASIATSSMLSEMVKGKSIDDALKITEEDLLEELDGLPDNKKHCSVLAVKALRNTIENYKSKNNKP